MSEDRVAGLAFKAREIEELVDVYFFRPLGWIGAVAARQLRLTPNAVSVLSGVAGVIGGALLYSPDTALAGFGGLVVYGILDSSDGQLARMTGQTSHLGRVLDGLAGYAAHIAIYLAIVFGVAARGGNGWAMFGWACLAGFSNVLQAQMYDYHRTTFAQVVTKGRAPDDPIVDAVGGPLRPLVGAFVALQRRMIGLHADVERVVTDRAHGGVVSAGDRQLYRQEFYGMVRRWNLFGDNGRRLAIGVLAAFQRVEWFCAFILVPMNIALFIVWRQQQRADERFLVAARATHLPAASA